MSDVKHESVVVRAYRKFYETHGYIPEMFNPYNCSEIVEIAPTLTSNCGSTTASSTVLIVSQKEGIWYES